MTKLKPKPKPPAAETRRWRLTWFGRPTCMIDLPAAPMEDDALRAVEAAMKLPRPLDQTAAIRVDLGEERILIGFPASDGSGIRPGEAIGRLDREPEPTARGPLTRVSVYLTPELHARVRAHARASGKSVSSVVTDAVSRGLDLAPVAG